MVAGWLGWLVGWLAGWLVGMDGWLVGWLAWMVELVSILVNPLPGIETNVYLLSD